MAENTELHKQVSQGKQELVRIDGRLQVNWLEFYLL